MIFHKTSLPGAWLVEPEKRSDDRGFFARTWCREEFAAHGLEERYVQRNLSVNPVAGTLRGMHWQAAPYGEVKLMQCTRGAIFDVIVDMRPASPTFRQWLAVELRARDYRMLYAPEGFAHGFQTLEDDTEVAYLVSAPYMAEASRGIRHDDPAIGIRWPRAVTRISEQDRGWPLLDEAHANAAR
jgi:dTDP-4-dehydrorhamnose 3,5-epimerase